MGTRAGLLRLFVHRSRHPGEVSAARCHRRTTTTTTASELERFSAGLDASLAAPTAIDWSWSFGPLTFTVEIDLAQEVLVLKGTVFGYTFADLELNAGNPSGISNWTSSSSTSRAP
ncbi:hypothetical protein [Actinoplanes sp. NPDC051851]|uniref:hypothetical protein n=1 Tax=Actinoplanes sp. NPDC051851 TaxID=3154753 RepID=UPI00341CC3FB